MYLTKSGFRSCLSCETKLYYLSRGYPRATDDDEYLRLLAEGGFIIGALAKMRYPRGVEMGRGVSPEEDFAQTREALRAGDATLFEASLLSQRSLAIADILERRGDTLRLIEVKSKSFAGSKEGNPFRTAKGTIRSEWLEYLFDVAFQYLIATTCFPEFRTTPYLLLVDTSTRSVIDGLPNLFSLKRGREGDPPEVEVRGEPAQLLKAAELLSEIDVSSEVDMLLPQVREKVARLEQSLAAHTKIPPRRSIVCRDCEYRGEDLAPSGFSECWQEMPQPEHHIFDLYFGTTIKVDGEPLLNQLISEGKASHFEVPVDALKGKRGERQRLQIECTRTGAEWFDPRLKAFLKDLRYPLHFIDFETTRTALPFHVGMRPFEQIAFQWSCHTVASRHAAPVHTEWINTEPRFPNFEFAKALMRTLSKDGTVLTWATHEGSALTDILAQMETYAENNDVLRQFLSLLVSSKGSQGRLVDMNKLTGDYYFHPEMKGRTSIKKVFPAVWRTNAELRKLPWFSAFEIIQNGEIQDPYQALPSLMVHGHEMSVQEGTAAMRAYEQMLFGELSSDAEAKRGVERLLLQYCHLDTLAMVAIWEHWQQLAERG